MLILTRKEGQGIHILLDNGEEIEFMIKGIHGNRVSVCVAAPKTIPIVRSESIGERRQNQEPDSGLKSTSCTT